MLLPQTCTCRHRMAQFALTMFYPRVAQGHLTKHANVRKLFGVASVYTCNTHECVL